MAGLLSLCLLVVAAPQAEPRDLRALLAKQGTKFERVLDGMPENRLQILVAEPEIQDDGRVVLRRSVLGDPRQYFYPASTVKLGAAVAALLELQRLAREPATGFDLGAEWRIGARFAGDAADTAWLPIEQDLRAMLVVSDNAAFNHCFEFVGPRALNAAMQDAGLSTCRVWHRLSEPRTMEQNRQTRAVELRQGARTHRLAARDEELVLDNSAFTDLTVGMAHVRGEQVVPQPMSFATKNAIALGDLQDLLAMLVRPDVELGKRGLPQLSVTARAFLVETLGSYPRESKAPVWSEQDYPDSYCKFVLPGVRRVVPAAHACVYDKSGRAYGFTIENAYVEDTRTGRGFFVAAVLYTNEDGIVGDDRYDYATLADPFFADLGEVLTRALLGAAGGEKLAPTQSR
ncbi:MAG: serine hydrolase [Planctomycetota bacterium]